MLTSIKVRVGSLSGGWNHTSPYPYEMWIKRKKVVDKKCLKCEGRMIEKL